MRIRKYQASDEKGWIYTKALSYLFSPFFDDRETEKPALNTDIYDHRIELVYSFSLTFITSLTRFAVLQYNLQLVA